MTSKHEVKQKTIIYDRTNFGEIIAEFWVPLKPSQKAVIICDGCPSVPSKRTLGEFFAKKGYWVFHMRYRGTWESQGEFLKYSPHEDVLHVAARLNLGFRGVFYPNEYFLDITDVTVVGTSFGGAAAAIASTSEIISRAVAVAPALDWDDIIAHSKEETHDDFVRRITEGFPGAYRCPKKNLDKLKTGKFFNPMQYVDAVDKQKLFIIHALDDKVVPVSGVKKFAKSTGIKPLYLKSGGHFSSKILLVPAVWREVAPFFKQVKK